MKIEDLMPDRLDFRTDHVIAALTRVSARHVDLAFTFHEMGVRRVTWQAAAGGGL